MKVTIPGNKISNKINKIKATRKGQDSFVNSPTEHSIIEQTEYIATPTGGVKRPIAQVITNTTPKYTRSTPILAITGTSIEVSSKIITVESITIPRSKRNSIIIDVITNGLSLNPRRNWDNSCGIISQVIP
jgi:hypothetical protein